MNLFYTFATLFVIWTVFVLVATVLKPKQMKGQQFPLLLAFFLWPVMLLRRALTGKCPMLDKATQLHVTQYISLEDLPFDREMSAENLEFIDVSKVDGYAFPFQADRYGRSANDSVGVANVRPKGTDDYYVAIAYGGNLLSALGPFKSHQDGKSAFRRILGQFNLTDAGCSTGRY